MEKAFRGFDLNNLQRRRAVRLYKKSFPAINCRAILSRPCGTEHTFQKPSTEVTYYVI